MTCVRVVVTGIGVVSPNGIGAAAFTDALAHGRSGIDWIPSLAQAPIQTRFGGALKTFQPSDIMDPRDLRRVPRIVPMALAAAREAMTMAKVAVGPESTMARDIGVILGSGGGAAEFIENQYRAFFTGEGKNSPFGVSAATGGGASSEISIALGLHGPSHVITNGCASSTDAIGYALWHIQRQNSPMMLAGGADAPITPAIIGGFELMRVLAAPVEPIQRASRPFSCDRQGFVLAEGAWMFLLEDYRHAVARGAGILAEVLGWASTCDAFHRVQPAPDAAESARAMQLAMTDAGVSPPQIQYVNLHGTGTVLNDRLETMAIHQCFGQHADKIPMSSTKSMIGHPQGACGAAGLAATILSLRQGFIAPTINLLEPAPECDLDYVPVHARPTDATLALCNCIAFGSKNSALVVRVHKA